MELLTADTETLVDTHGQTGGPDYNLGSEFSKRFVFTTGRADEPYLTATVTNFIVGKDTRKDDHRQDVQWDDLEDLLREKEAYQDAQARFLSGEGVTTEDMYRWSSENPAPVEFFWRTEIQYTYHTDLEDAGSSEVRAEIEYTDVTINHYPSITEAEIAAKRDMDSWSVRSFNLKNL